MKKLILILFVTILITGCATSTKQQTIDAESDETVEIEQKEDSIKSNNFPTSEQLLQALKKRNANLLKFLMKIQIQIKNWADLAVI